MERRCCGRPRRRYRIAAAAQAFGGLFGPRLNAYGTGPSDHPSASMRIARDLFLCPFAVQVQNLSFLSDLSDKLLANGNASYRSR